MELYDILTNAYFYLGCINTVIIIGLMIILWRRIYYSATVHWLQLYLGVSVLVSIGQLGQFFGKSEFMFDMAVSIGTVAVVLYPISLFYFILNFLNLRKWLEQSWLSIMIWAVSIAFLVIGLRTFTIYAQSPDLRILEPWGYIVPGTAEHQLVFVVWAHIWVILGAGLLVRSYLRSPDRMRRRQTLLMIIGILTIEIAGTLTQAVLPLFNMQVLPSTLYIQSLQAFILTFALLRYGVTAIDPNAITSSIVQTMNNAALALDTKGKVIFANAAADKLLGSPEHKLVGRHIEKFISPRQVTDFKNNFLHPLSKTGLSQITESAVINARGKTLAVNAYGSTYREKSGRISATTVIFADIQDLKNLLADATRLSEELAIEKQSVEAKVVERTHELHQEQAKLRASIESLALGFMLVDDNGRILIQNKALHNIFGLPDQVKSLEQITKLLAGCDLAEQCQIARTKSHPIEVKEVSSGPKIFHLFIGPVTAGGHGKNSVIGTVVLVEDITEEKVLARSKDEFFSIASHELNTPLTAIKGNSGMALKYFDELVSKEPDLKDMLHDIHESSVRLIDIVRDFLDMSRIEQGKMVFHPGPVAIDKIVESIFYAMRTTIDDKHVALKADTHTLGTMPLAWGDKDRVTQILYNLIGNAAKFTEKGSITVDTKVKNDVLRVRVSDTGRGVPLQNQKLLFHKFQQAGDSLLTRDGTRGTGLGLYISKLMAEKMGGTVALESSKEGEGSVFYFEIPIATKSQLAGDTETIDSTAYSMNVREDISPDFTSLNRPAA